MIEIEASGQDCICDFTFDFYWQHKGSRLDPDKAIGGISFRKLVEDLKRGEIVRIKGYAGSRLGSSLGVDLVKFGGKGGPIEGTGKIIVDGDVGSRMGISMLRGAFYVSGKVELPLGNIIEAESDLSGYRKYISITEALEHGIAGHNTADHSTAVLEPNIFDKNGLLIRDGILRDTVGARMASGRTILIKGNAGMSTGILMRSGLIDISGNADRNTGVLMKGGRIVVCGNTGDFTGTEMNGGEIFIAGNAGSYICSKMKGGAVYAKGGRPVPPAKAQILNAAEITNVAKFLGLNQMYAMMYKRFGLSHLGSRR
ncbi:MAG: tributyrin esterase [Methanotrichaceae archaeon]